MAEPSSLRDRYLTLIDDLVQMTLKGKIRSKEQVYQLLMQGIETGTGEIFERALGERLNAVQHDSETQTDEFKQAKAARSLRALNTIRGEWERWQSQNQAKEGLSNVVTQVQAAEADLRLPLLLQALDPNSPQPLTLTQIAQLATQLRQAAQTHQDAELAELGDGLVHGLEDWQRLQDHLVSWIYDQNREMGFGGGRGQQGPWPVWAARVERLLPQSLFQALALEQSLIDWTARTIVTRGQLLELVVLLGCLHKGLVAWFDKLVYDSKVGAKLSISTFIAFAVIWSQMANGFGRVGSGLMDACFQVTLQLMRAFAQQSYFPLYGGIYASFSGQYLRDALDYLDEPLRRAEGTQDTARVLTLLGYSYRAQGRLDQAISFHRRALDIARQASDRPCEIANLNHLSRVYVSQEQYEEAIRYSQQALVLSRQYGDRPGEANALANLGYSEVFRAQQIEADTDTYEMAVSYLQQGLQLSDRLGDRQSQALCLSSLGIAHVVLNQGQEAIAYLEGSVQAAQFTGDVYLQGLSLAYLAEAHYRLENIAQAVLTGSLGMYLLEQIASNAWRQPAGLLTVIKGQQGDEAFQAILHAQRPTLIASIGIDGYDYLPDLLTRYLTE
jgi:tetratricopeptide (TPR) repeat protein